MDIIQALDDERFFRKFFRNPNTWQNWRTFLRARHGLPFVSDAEHDLYRECTGLDYIPGKRHKEAFVIIGRRSGKSSICAVEACALAAFRDWRKSLSCGEKGYIFIISPDKTQSRVIRDYIKTIMHLTPHLEKLVEKELSDEIHLRNNVVIMVKTPNYRRLRGFTVLGAICDELAFWRSEESANPDTEIVNALRPAMVNIPDSMLLGISSPHSRTGLLYEMYKKYFGEQEGPLIWQSDSMTMNPALDPSEIEAAYAQDPAVASSEYGSQFRADLEKFLPLNVIEAAVVFGRFELSPCERFRYFGFVDFSGGRVDSSALCIVHREEDGRIIMDCLRERRSPHVPQKVVQEFSMVLKSYGVYSVYGDRYSAEWSVSSLRECGIMLLPAEMSKSELYTNFLPLLMNGTIVLLDNKRLVNQFNSLERRTRSGGRDVIDHPPFSGYKDDLSNAVAGAAVLC